MRLIVLLGALLAMAGPTMAQQSNVVINDYRLSQQELNALGGPGFIPAGTYWYDSASGFWGHIGLPVEGQGVAGLNIGQLRADASRGTACTFINGRRLTAIEVALLSRQGPVLCGRFWMNALGVFGYEGGGALGQVALGGGGGGQRRSSLSERGLLFRPGEILGGR